MNKTILIIFFSLIAILIIGILFISFQPARKQNHVCFKVNCFDVELALTQEEWGSGLMFREKLGQDEGMLFVFDAEALHSFWMKNTLIPLDIIWLDKDKKAVFISKDTQPCRIDPCFLINPDKAAKYVLELNAGIVDKIGLKIGDGMTF